MTIFPKKGNLGYYLELFVVSNTHLPQAGEPVEYFLRLFGTAIGLDDDGVLL